MKIVCWLFLAFAMLVQAQTAARNVKTSDKNQKAVLDFVRGMVISNEKGDSWKCMNGANPCSKADIQMLQAEFGRSTKGVTAETLTVDPDGTFRCTSAQGKVCSNDEVRAIIARAKGLSAAPAREKQ